MIRPNRHDRVANPDGTRTIEDQKIMDGMYAKILELEAKLDAIAAVTSPTGGMVIDAEARTAIDAVIAAAT